MRWGWILATSSWHSMDPGADVAADGVDRDEEVIGRVDSMSIESCLRDVSVELFHRFADLLTVLWLDDVIYSSSVIGWCDLFQFCDWMMWSLSVLWLDDVISSSPVIGLCDHYQDDINRRNAETMIWRVQTIMLQNINFPPCYFLLQNSDIATVNINITKLPLISTFIFSTQTEQGGNISVNFLF